MKTLIVGANHAGIAVANTLLNHNVKDVVMIDANSNLSYLGCGTALWVGRQIDSVDGLFYTKAEDFRDKGAKIELESNVTKIDFDNKIASYTKGGKEYTETYDNLVLATGSIPIMPKVEGMDLANIHFLKRFQDGQIVDQLISDPKISKVAVVGGGYIGVEIAEACKRRNKEVMLFDVSKNVLSNYYDAEFSTEMDKVLVDNGIQLHTEESVKGFEGNSNKLVNKIITNKGSYDVDLVVNAIGFRPNNELGKDKLKLFGNGAYLVDKYQRTSIKDVYAVGDCATVYSNALQNTAYIALATNAVRTGLVAASNILGKNLEGNGVQGSNAISIFGYNMMSTGLSVASATKMGITDICYNDHEDLQKPAFIKHNNHKVKIRIVYERVSRRIIGAQIASYEDVSAVIHMFSLAIQEKVTIDKLALTDIFFLPHFNQPYNYITVCALKSE
ncbi:MAG: FAD-dependent oxidoreductase [Clostridiales bacterium]|jgi:NADPH-dependent 2,4-dienoyl-CoA reductase/sulfur reductase-like enzyme|nr:FAD-dependent oxidoreductase [Clostridiales bacterium]